MLKKLILIVVCFSLSYTAKGYYKSTPFNGIAIEAMKSNPVMLYRIDGKTFGIEYAKGIVDTYSMGFKFALPLIIKNRGIVLGSDFTFVDAGEIQQYDNSGVLSEEYCFRRFIWKVACAGRVYRSFIAGADLEYERISGFEDSNSIGAGIAGGYNLNFSSKNFVKSLLFSFYIQNLFLKEFNSSVPVDYGAGAFVYISSGKYLNIPLSLSYQFMSNTPYLIFAAGYRISVRSIPEIQLNIEIPYNIDYKGVNEVNIDLRIDWFDYFLSFQVTPTQPINPVYRIVGGLII